MKLVVGYPWASPFMFTKFVDSALDMKHPEGVDVRFVRGTGWCPARRHIDLCEKALALDADLICIIGSDQTYPRNMLVKLVNRFNDGCEVVSALVPTRGYIGWQPMKPFQSMAWRYKTNTELGSNKLQIYHGMELSKNLIHVIDPKDGDIQKVNFIGSGVLMFHRDHLLSLKKPWFIENIDYEKQQRIACMDSWFVWRLQREAYATVWVDTTIKVGHAHVFEIDETYSERFADWVMPGVGDLNICLTRNKE